MDRMTEQEQKELQEMFSDCVYATGQSFNVMTCDIWKKFFTRLRPKFKVPDRKKISNQLLDKSYDKVSKLTDDHINQSDYVSLVIDGATNVNRDSIINIVAMTPSPVFLESIDTKGATKDANYMCHLLVPIIEKLQPRKITGLISDNESKMISLKDKIIEKYPHIIFSGCVGHKLNGLIGGICDRPLIQKLVVDAKPVD